MNIKKFLSFFIGLLLTCLVPNYAMAALNGVTIPKTGKVVICHYPPGNIANVQNITISVQALNAHLWDGIAGDQHEWDELEVNGVCPYAESQKNSAVAAVTTATQTLTTAQTQLATATQAVVVATTNLNTAQNTVAKSSPKSQNYATLQTAVVIAQTTLTQAVVTQTAAQTAVTTAQTNLDTVKATADAVIAAVETATAQVAVQKADPTPTKVTICHVNNPGNGRVEVITVSTNGWTDETPWKNHHDSHIDDYVADVNNQCTSNNNVVPTVDTVDAKNVTPNTPIETSDTTPLITGSVGTTRLGKDEPFSVTVNSVTYTEGTNLTLHANKTWALQIPDANKLSVATYEVKATRSGVNDLTSNEFKVTLVCTLPQVLNRTNTACIAPEMWNGLLVSEIIALNAKWGTESYLGNSCQKNIDDDNTNGIVNTEWADCRRPGGTFKSHVQTDNKINYHCHFEVTGTGISGTKTIEAQFNVPSTLTVQQKWDLINSKCSGTTISCTAPQILNKAKTACITTPTVTTTPISVDSATTSVPITGTFGGAKLVDDSNSGISENVRVKVGNDFYFRSENQVLKGGDDLWTLSQNVLLNVPGDYAITVCRDGDKLDISSWTVCGAGTLSVSKTTPSQTPTVNYQKTEDTTPIISGTVGATIVDANEEFTVSIANTSQSFSKAQITFNCDGESLKWCVNITTPLTLGNYNVIVTRGTKTDESNPPDLEIVCDAPKTFTNGECVSLSPTVDTVDGENVVVSGTARTVSTANKRAVITGSVGSVPLNGDVLSITLNNVTYSYTISGTTTWIITPTTDLEIGKYEIVVTRKHGNVSHVDGTIWEMEITGGQCCINNVTQVCPESISPPNRKAACESTGGDLPTKSQILPTRPEAKTPEFIRNSNGDCEDGGKLSYDTAINNATIKRARIANAITEKGTFVGSLAGKRLVIGNLTAGTYNTDNCSEEDYCESRTITGATLTDALIDITPDYIDANGNVSDESNQGIVVINGITKPTYKNRNGEDKNAVITNGMIVAGTANNVPVRGLVTNGIFISDIDNATNNPNLVKTKGREADKVTLTNVTITNAAITTDKNGKTVVGCDNALHPTCSIATISEWNESSTISGEEAFVYGTVVNAVLKNVTLGESNHCFSSGTVGNKGQLNWKEVVK